MEKKSLQKRLNLMVLITYLIKYGASGFIDEFRALMDSFTRYEALSLNEKESDPKLTAMLLELGQRATYIKQLLNDKGALSR
jgi:hypothetical protein